METGSSEQRAAKDAGRCKIARKAWRGWRRRFLVTLAETSNVSEAAAIAGVTASHAYRVRRNDPAFASQWHAALLEGYEHLEMEVLHRLRHGTDASSAQRKFDNSGALRLLALHKDTIDRLRGEREHRSETDVLAEINARIDRMRAPKANTGSADC